MLRSVVLDVEMIELFILVCSIIAIPWVIWVTSSVLKIKVMEASLKRSHDRLDRRPSKIELESFKNELKIEISYMKDAMLNMQSEIKTLQEMLRNK